LNAQELKEFLKEDLSRVEKVLESIGCHKIWRTGNEIRCAPPISENHTAISVNIDTLFVRYYRREETFRSDLIGLVQYFREESFADSFRYIKSLFGLGGKFTKEKKRRDPLHIFKNIRKQHHEVIDIDEIEIPKFGLETLDEFIQVPHISLFYEGIMPQTAELFRVCYDPKLDRIIFPHFSFDDKNAIVGITGRTTKSKEEIKELLIPKYWNYIKGYKKTYNLYGFSHAIEYVKKYGILVIFEAEKSVLKNFTQYRNEGFSCSVGGHEISPYQVQIIMKYLPPEVEVCIAFDKDIMFMKDKDGNIEDEEGNLLGEKFLIKVTSMFSRYRKASYIFDDLNLLGENDSPIDQGYRVFHKLLERRRYVF